MTIEQSTAGRAGRQAILDYLNKVGGWQTNASIARALKVGTRTSAARMTMMRRNEEIATKVEGSGASERILYKALVQTTKDKMPAADMTLRVATEADEREAVSKPKQLPPWVTANHTDDPRKKPIANQGGQACVGSGVRVQSSCTMI